MNVKAVLLCLLIISVATTSGNSCTSQRGYCTTRWGGCKYGYESVYNICGKWWQKCCVPKDKCTPKGGKCVYAPYACPKLTYRVYYPCSHSSTVCCKPYEDKCTPKGGKCVYAPYACPKGTYRIYYPCSHSSRVCCKPYGISNCQKRGGTCKHTWNWCPTKYVSGLCPGPSYNQCCFSNECGRGGGKCLDIWKYHCPGGYRSGHCPRQANHIRCCYGRHWWKG